MRHAFDALQLPRLICMMFPENTPSVNVARKIGMALEAEKEDEKGKFLLYARHRCADMAGDWTDRPPC